MKSYIRRKGNPGSDELQQAWRSLPTALQDKFSDETIFNLGYSIGQRRIGNKGMTTEQKINTQYPGINELTKWSVNLTPGTLHIHNIRKYLDTHERQLDKVRIPLISFTGGYISYQKKRIKFTLGTSMTLEQYKERNKKRGKADVLYTIKTEPGDYQNIEHPTYEERARNNKPSNIFLTIIDTLLTTTEYNILDKILEYPNIYERGNFAIHDLPSTQEIRSKKTLARKSIKEHNEIPHRAMYTGQAAKLLFKQLQEHPKYKEKLEIEKKLWHRIFAAHPQLELYKRSIKHIFDLGCLDSTKVLDRTKEIFRNRYEELNGSHQTYYYGGDMDIESLRELGSDTNYNHLAMCIHGGHIQPHYIDMYQLGNKLKVPNKIVYNLGFTIGNDCKQIRAQVNRKIIEALNQNELYVFSAHIFNPKDTIINIPQSMKGTSKRIAKKSCQSMGFTVNGLDFQSVFLGTQDTIGLKRFEPNTKYNFGQCKKKMAYGKEPGEKIIATRSKRFTLPELETEITTRGGKVFDYQIEKGVGVFFVKRANVL